MATEILRNEDFGRQPPEGRQRRRRSRHEEERDLKSQVEMPELMTVEEVSEITRIPKSTLQNWAADADRGMLPYGPPHIRLSPRKRVWAKDDVLGWIDEKRNR